LRIEQNRSYFAQTMAVGIAVCMRVLNMQRQWSKLFFYPLMLSVFFSTNASAVMDENSNTGIKHIGLCWLKDAGNTEQVDQLVKSAQEMAAAIPEIVDVVAGAPLPKEDAATGETFDFGMITTFKNIEDLVIYRVHPEHKKRAKKVFAPLCERTLVYDIAY